MLAIPMILLAIPDESDRAFAEALFQEHGRAMLQAALQIVGDIATAEDMVADACVLMVKNLDGLRKINCCKRRCYVVSIVRNFCISHVNKRNRQSKYNFFTGDDYVLDAVADENAIDDALILQVNADELNRALQLLSERDRTLLQMKYYEQQPDAEIAACLGISTSSVRSYLTRARRALKKLLEGRL